MKDAKTQRTHYLYNYCIINARKTTYADILFHNHILVYIHTYIHINKNSYIYIYIHWKVSQKVMLFSLGRNNYQHRRHVLYITMKLVLRGSHFLLSTSSLFLSMSMVLLWMRAESLHRKILLTVLWTTSSLQISLPRHLSNVCLLNLFSWGKNDDSLKVLNFVSIEDVIKLSTQST